MKKTVVTKSAGCLPGITAPMAAIAVIIASPLGTTLPVAAQESTPGAHREAPGVPLSGQKQKTAYDIEHGWGTEGYSSKEHLGEKEDLTAEIVTEEGKDTEMAFLQVMKNEEQICKKLLISSDYPAHVRYVIRASFRMGNHQYLLIMGARDIYLFDVNLLRLSQPIDWSDITPPDFEGQDAQSGRVEYAGAAAEGLVCEFTDYGPVTVIPWDKILWRAGPVPDEPLKDETGLNR